MTSLVNFFNNLSAKIYRAQIVDTGGGSIRIYVKNNNKVTILGTGKPTTGSHNKPILFLHPKEFCGTLIELEEE